jgi:hypothetical protein
MPPETRSQKRKRLDIDPEEPVYKKLRSYNQNPNNYKKWNCLNKSPKFKEDYGIYKPDHFKWISASSTKNYLLKDPLIDWLDLYFDKLAFNTDTSKQMIHIKSHAINSSQGSHSSHSSQGSQSSHSDNFNILFSKGNQFENLVITELKNKFKDETIEICKTKTDFFNKSLVSETFNAMKNSIPIIIQAMLVNEDNYTFGVADLLVRSDYLNKMFKESPNYDEVNLPAKFLNDNNNYHYVVIDIKWSTINLSSNGENILNSERVPAYKGQLAIYNLALGNLQGHIPSKAFVLGKGWKWNSKSLHGYDCLDKCGIVDFNDFDEHYIEFTSKAVNWLRDVRFEGHTWNCLQPKRSEMYPNMCHMGDAKWDSVKSELSDNLHELTKIWMVSVNHRDYAHNNGIYSWKDFECSSEMLNINGKKLAPIVDKFIEINRDEDKIMIPDNITINTHNWLSKHDLDFYIDFETINDVFMKDKMNIKDSQSYSDICFRISVGYEENNTYKSIAFTMDNYNLEQEKRIFLDFKTFIENKVSIYMKKNNIKNRQIVKPKLFHWAIAEQTFINHANERHNFFLNSWLKKNQVVFVDMCKVFIDEPIIIKGMFNFKLKEVAHAMYEHKMISTKWDDEINNGLVAMMGATKYYKDTSNGDNKKLMKKIEDYNDIDVKVLWEIVTYLRNKLQ